MFKTQQTPVFQEMAQLLRNEEIEELEAVLDKSHTADVKKLLVRLNPWEAALLVSLSRKDILTRAFGLLGPTRQRAIVEELSEEVTKDFLNRLAVDDLTVFMARLPDKTSEHYFSFLEPELKQQVEFQLTFPPESVGRIMTPSYFRVNMNWTAEETISFLHDQGMETETIKTVYITDDEGMLLDEITLRSIMLSDPETPIAELMDQRVVTLSPEDDREIAVEMMETHDEYVLPVVDDERKMLGVVTMDDIMKYAQWEETEDFQLFGGSSPLRSSYFSTSLWTLARKRFGWLLILFIAGSLSSTVIGFFEEQIAAVVMLTFFIPLLIGTGGNAGSQTVTTVIRALALGEVKFRHIFSVILRETVVGILLGTILGAAGFAFVYFYWSTSVLEASIIGLSLPAVCILANSVAATIPLLVDWLGLDPAVVSAPVITTFVDVGGLVLYFMIAAAVLGI